MPEKELPKTYNAKDWEKKLYTLWEESGFFNPDNLPGERPKTFSTIMPPPNANGRLHAGHGLDMTLKDILVRYKRMAGYRALWIPGADHAGFETQIVYERKLESEGRSRFDMKPDELYQNILEFTLENKRHMEDDVRSMGASCDWSREKFTLDPDVITAVQKTFKKMFDDGLVYRGNRIVNWCSQHQTSLSEVETEFIEKTDPFYYLKYGPFVIGTARPETKFGDKYVVMHPEDERYSEYTHGQTLELEWINGPITATVIKDAAVDREFGTGVMTITPWHDPVDFDIAERHGLDKEQIIDFDGKLLPLAGEFSGLSLNEARTKIVAKLESKGLVDKIDTEYQHSIKSCYKCSTPIEPQIKSQWFVRMQPLAEMAMAPVRDGRINFLPKRFEKIFFHWMTNTIDWNISRQIIWGIPIPAKLCPACSEGFPDLENVLTTCPKCHQTLVQDTDTFDTWFSSGQWPLLTLGFPDGSDFHTYYPTTIMETGADLVFKWVPRMIMFGMYLADRPPFETVYFHGMVNDEHNQKMSKSKGNVISPILLGEQYGTDALRMALITGNGPGNNVPLSLQKVETFRNFANKLWNISRYVLGAEKSDNTKPLSFTDQWILSRLSIVTEEVTAHLEKYQISLAAETLREFTLNDFADWYIEIHKIEKNTVVLRKVFESLLKLWHPFMPFVTEALWSQLEKGELLLIATWPLPEKTSPATKDFTLLQNFVVQIRNLRALYRLSPKACLSVSLSPHALLESNQVLLETLTSTKLTFVPTDQKVSGTVRLVSAVYTAHVHLADLVDIAAEKKRLEQELQTTKDFMTGLKSRLENETFRSKAPADVIEAQEKTLSDLEKKYHELEAARDALS